MTPLLDLQTFAPPDIEMERRPDGAIILRSRQALGEWEPSITAVLRARAAQHPDRLRLLRLMGEPAKFPGNLVDVRAVGVCVNDLAKAAELPVNDGMLAALVRYRTFLGLSPLPEMQEARPLIMDLSGGKAVTLIPNLLGSLAVFRFERA